MDYTAKSPSLQRLDRHTSNWVYYQMRRKGITCTEIATRSKRSQSFVSLVLCGARSSLPVYDVLCRALGYSDMDALLADARRSAA